jgi:hypothetical protein
MAEIWGAALAVAGGVYAANKQAGAANAAGQAGVDAANASNATNLAMFNQQRADSLPAMINGQLAQREYMSLLGFDVTPPSNTAEAMQKYLQENPDVAADPYWGQHAWEHYTQHGQAEGRAWGTPAQYDPALAQASREKAYAQFRSTPGYDFNLKEGQRALESGAAASGQLFSGKTGKALVQYGQNYADRTFGDYTNRLASVAGMGQTATAQSNAAAQNYGSQYGAQMNNAAQSRQSAIAGSANAWSNFGNQLAGMGGYYANNR